MVTSLNLKDRNVVPPLPKMTRNERIKLSDEEDLNTLEGAKDDEMESLNIEIDNN